MSLAISIFDRKCRRPGSGAWCSASILQVALVLGCSSESEPRDGEGSGGSAMPALSATSPTESGSGSLSPSVSQAPMGSGPAATAESPSLGTPPQSTTGPMVPTTMMPGGGIPGGGGTGSDGGSPGSAPSGAESGAMPGGGGAGGASPNDDPMAMGGSAGGGFGGAAGSGGASDVEGGSAGAGGAGGSLGDGGEGVGPNVDRAEQRLYELQFRPTAADPGASAATGNQYAYLDTRVEPAGKLVVYLHGAGAFNDCGNLPLGTMVAGWGFHWFAPCFSSNYGVDNCGDDIEGCRLEAFEGEDHHPFINISRSDSIEERIVRGLEHLQQEMPAGDWEYFLEGSSPRWSEIIITGHSHGASTSGVIGMYREVYRVVMLAGPYDPGQAWLNKTPVTPRDRFYGFSHSGDGQHQGHLAAFASLGLPGEPVRVDSADPPYGGSHRLYSSAGVGDAHQSVTTGDVESFVPVWHYMYAE